MIDRKEAGLLLTPDIKLHRNWFKEMTSLIGVGVVYYIPVDKVYTNQTEIKGYYYQPFPTHVIYEESPSQRTMKALGWVSELQDGASIIHVSYDLPQLQVGSLFLMPSGLDNAEGRLFRVSQMGNIALYPASIACMIVPEFKDDFNDHSYEHKHDSFNLLEQGEGLKK